MGLLRAQHLPAGGTYRRAVQPSLPTLYVIRNSRASSTWSDHHVSKGTSAMEQGMNKKKGATPIFLY